MINYYETFQKQTMGTNYYYLLTTLVYHIVNYSGAKFISREDFCERKMEVHLQT